MGDGGSRSCSKRRLPFARMLLLQDQQKNFQQLKKICHYCLFLDNDHKSQIKRQAA